MAVGRTGVRKFLERLFFSNLKPDAPATLPRRVRLQSWLERQTDGLLLRKLKPVDPFYVTNRSRARKLALGALIGVPIVLVLCGILAVSGYLPWNPFAPAAPDLANMARPAANQSSEPTPVVPVHTEAIPLDVVSVEVRRTARPPLIDGTVRNTSGAPVTAARITFNVTDTQGMVLGAASAVVRKVPPHGTATFRVEAPLEGAANALVRDITPE